MPLDSQNHLDFLICCVQNSEQGKVNFQAVADKMGIVSKGAAAKRFERLIKASPMASGKARSKQDSPAAKTAADGATNNEKGGASASKKRKYPEPKKDDDEEEEEESKPRVKREKKEEEDEDKKFKMENHSHYVDEDDGSLDTHIPPVVAGGSGTTGHGDDDDVVLIRATEKTHANVPPLDNARAPTETPFAGCPAHGYGANVAMPPQVPSESMAPSSTLSSNWDADQDLSSFFWIHKLH